MYIEIKTAEINKLQDFVRDNAPSLNEHAIDIRLKDGEFHAKIYEVNEPAT